MRKFLLLIMLGLLFAFPASVFAQSDLKLTNVNVQLWPEYDQPSMLVITDFEIPATTALPVNVTFRIPQDANLIAVAVYSADGALTNAIFEGPQEDGEWQSFTVSLDSTAGRFEYYQTLSFNGNQRIFSYLWDGIYAVDTFAIRVLEPFDTTSLKTDPALTSISQESNLKYYEGEPVTLASGEQFILNLEYEKTTDTLIVNTQGVQPSAPVDENTPGRVSLKLIKDVFLGTFNPKWEGKLSEMSGRELITIVPLVVLTILIGVYPAFLLQKMGPTLEQLILHVVGK